MRQTSFEMKMESENRRLQVRRAPLVERNTHTTSFIAHPCKYESTMILRCDRETGDKHQRSEYFVPLPSFLFKHI